MKTSGFQVHPIFLKVFVGEGSYLISIYLSDYIRNSGFKFQI